MSHYQKLTFLFCHMFNNFLGVIGPVHRCFSFSNYTKYYTYYEHTWKAHADTLKQENAHLCSVCIVASFMWPRLIQQVFPNVPLLSSDAFFKYHWLTTESDLTLVQICSAILLTVGQENGTKWMQCTNQVVKSPFAPRINLVFHHWAEYKAAAPYVCRCPAWALSATWQSRGEWHPYQS